MSHACRRGQLRDLNSKLAVVRLQNAQAILIVRPGVQIRKPE